MPVEVDLFAKSPERSVTFVCHSCEPARMAQRPIPMPDESTVPRGPARDLLLELHRLYRSASTPSLRQIQSRTQHDDPPLSTEAARLLLHGLNPEPTWPRVRTLAALFIRMADFDEPSEAIEAVRRRWTVLDQAQKRLRREDATPMWEPPADSEEPDYATHFAKLAYAKWALDHRSIRSGQAPIQGTLALVANDFDPMVMGRSIFDRHFQTWHIRQLQEWGQLRHDGHSFSTNETFGPNSYTVWGEITGRLPKSFIAVEVFDRGAVSVFFRENPNARSLASVVGKWVYGAAHAAAYIHQELGSTGRAQVSLILNRSGILGERTARTPWRKSSDHLKDLLWLDHAGDHHDYLWSHEAHMSFRNSEDGSRESWPYTHAVEITDACCRHLAAESDALKEAWRAERRRD